MLGEGYIFFFHFYTSPPAITDELARIQLVECFLEHLLPVCINLQLDEYVCIQIDFRIISSFKFVYKQIYIKKIDLQKLKALRKLYFYKKKNYKKSKPSFYNLKTRKKKRRKHYL